MVHQDGVIGEEVREDELPRGVDAVVLDQPGREPEDEALEASPATSFRDGSKEGLRALLILTDMYVPVSVHEFVEIPLGRPRLETVAACLRVFLTAEAIVGWKFLVRLFPPPISEH